MLESYMIELSGSLIISPCVREAEPRALVFNAMFLCARAVGCVCVRTR